MILEQGEKLHIATRRAFEDDLRRHFVGEVTEIDAGLARIEGYAFVLDTGTNSYSKRPEKRIRIVSLSDANNLINVLPDSTVIDEVRYEVSEGRLVATDGKHFRLDINEFGIKQ